MPKTVFFKGGSFSLVYFSRKVGKGDKAKSKRKGKVSEAYTKANAKRK